VIGLAGSVDNQDAVELSRWLTSAASVGAGTALAEADPVVVLAAAAMAAEDAAATGVPPVAVVGRLVAPSAATARAALWLACAGAADDRAPFTGELCVAAALGVEVRVDAPAPTREPRRAPGTAVTGTESACATTTSPADRVVAADAFGTTEIRARGAAVAREGTERVEAAAAPGESPVSATETAGTASVHTPMPKATAKAPTRPTQAWLMKLAVVIDTRRLEVQRPLSPRRRPPSLFVSAPPFVALRSVATLLRRR